MINLDGIREAVKSFLFPGLGEVTYGGGHARYRAPDGKQIDQNSIIQACLVTILDGMAGAQIVTSTSGPDGKPIYDHTTPFASLMMRPDPLRKISGRRMLRAAVASYELDGNAYLDPTFDGTGSIVELRWVPHWAVTPKGDPRTGLLSHYEIAVKNGPPQKRKPDELIHIANGIDPKNELEGQSPVKSLMLQVMTDNECDAFSAEIIANPAIVGIAVIPKGKNPGPANAEYVENKIQTKFGRGSGGRGGTFVPSFEASIEKIGFSPAELAIDKMRQIPEERISAVMNVPAIVAGLGAGLSRSTFKNSEEARRYFAQYKIAPLMGAFEDELSVQLLPFVDGYQDGQKAAFDRRQIPDLQPDYDRLANRAAQLFQADLITRAQGLAMLGEEADPKRDNIFYSEIPRGAGLEPSVRSRLSVKNRIQDRRRMFEALGIAEVDDADDRN